MAPIPKDEWPAFLRERKGIKDIGGVVGVGIAGPEVIVYVDKMRPEIFRELPEDVGGSQVLVREVGKFRIMPLLTIQASRTEMYRPVPGGVSIGHFLGETGTHGASVWRGDQKVGLSNNHVCGLVWGIMNEGKIGDPILQPGLYDYGGPGSEIGELLDYEPVSLVGNNRIDAAIYSGDFTDEILGIGAPAEAVRMEPGMLVAKSGRTTQVTTSMIESVGAMVDVEGFGSVCRFEDVAITTTAFSKGGDSGSLVVDNWCRSCGPLFAGSEAASVVCEAVNVEVELGIKFGVTEPHLLNLRTHQTAPGFTLGTIFVGGVLALFSKQV